MADWVAPARFLTAAPGAKALALADTPTDRVKTTKARFIIMMPLLFLAQKVG
jgi:hypothetical protein